MLRKINRGGVILATLLALAGCQSEKLVDDSGSQGGQVTLTASRGVSSRTHLGSDGKQTVWSEGDKIYVSSADGKVTGVLSLTSEAGLPDGTFTGFVFGDPDRLAYSVFPVPENGKTIDLSQVTGGDKIDAPMVGPINDGNVPFENTCGILRLNLQDANGKNFTISAKNATNEADAQFYTTATVKVENGVAKLEYTSSSNTTIALNNAVGGFMYVPYFVNEDVDVCVDGIEVAEVKQNEFIGKLKQEDVKTLVYSMTTNGLITPTDVQIDASQNVSNQTLTLNISSSATTNPDQGGDSSTPTQEVHEFVNVPSITEALTGEGDTEVEVTSVVVELPKITETTTATKSVVSFEEIPQGVTVTIQEETSSDNNKTESVEELTVILPSGTTAEEAKETVNINMPNTTVTVKSADGNVLLINEMTAATADQTLIIGKNVEIGTLSILKGGMKIEGKVNRIIREEGNEDSVTGILIGSGAIVGNLLELMQDTNFSVDFENEADRPEVEIYEGNPTEREIELKRAAKNGGTFTLSGGGLRLTSPLIVEKDFTLNFSDGAFDGDEGQFVDSKQWKAMVVVMPGATFTFNGGGSFNTGHKETQITCIRMAGGSDKPSKVIMNGGSLIGTYHAILIDEDCQNAEVEINGGTLSCDWWNEFHGVNIFNKSDAKITIKGGNLTTYTETKISCIEMWGGELNISGGQFNTTLTSTQEGLDVNPNVGNTLIGPAVAIAPKRDVTVNISGGTFTGDGSSSFLEKIVDSSLLGKVNVNLSITGGTFDSAVSSQDCQNFISGGKFKVQPKDIYLVSNKSFVKNGDYYELVDGEGGENENPDEGEINTGVSNGSSSASNFGNGGKF